MGANTGWEYVVIWVFRVRPGKEQRFEELYGPDGVWERFFRQDADYLKTELGRGQQGGQPSMRYVTVDYWSSQAAYERFRSLHASEYAAIDAQCEELTESETEIGRFGRVK